MGKNQKKNKKKIEGLETKLEKFGKQEVKEVPGNPISIDVIIPCHNSHATLDRTLGSILCQRILPSVKVTLVRDGGEHYDDIIKRYSPVMNIQEIGYDDNGGPGKARNYGMTHTDGRLIIFIDSDDCLASPFTLIEMCNEIYSEPGIMILVCDFMEEIQPMHFKRHTDDVTFVHGKMYKREYLERNNILFNEKEGSNEDVGFNILSLVILKPNEKVKYTKYLAHYWLCNPNSIVRSNKDVFDHSTSFRTFVKNMEYVFDEVAKRGYQNTVEILEERVASMGRIVNLYHEKTIGYPQYQEENYAMVKEFYKTVYQPYEKYIIPEMTEDAHKRYPYKDRFQLSLEQYYEFLKKLGE